MEKPVGMYSAEAALRFGSVTWVNEAGTKFNITAYVQPSKYKWPDAVIVTKDAIKYHSGACYDYNSV